MKLTVIKAIVLLGILCFSTFSSVADTIDYWHVRYKGKLIRAYNIHAYEKVINLKSAQIKTFDSISVAYGTDRPCSSCEIQLILLDDKKRKYIIAKGKGSFKSTSFSLKDALKIGGKGFDIYYQDAYERNQYLFTIKIE
jgi:hypothetical protein